MRATEARARSTDALAEADLRLAELAAEAECCKEAQLEMEQDSNTVNNAGRPRPLALNPGDPLCSYDPCA